MLSSFKAAPTEAIVCVPARNEAERISSLMVSLAAQTVIGTTGPLKVVIVCNNTTDGTGRVVHRFKDEPRLTIKVLDVTFLNDMAHAGSARRLAMDTGADWCDAIGVADGVLISTDADAIAPKTWVAANLKALAKADLVGGRLVIMREKRMSQSLVKLDASIDRYWAAVRALEDEIDPPEHDPSPRHGDHTGASLALSTASYRAVGGLPPIATGEDNALVSAITRAGGRVRHCPDVWIEVSAREAGRAAGGMAKEMVRRRETLATAGPYLLPGASYWRAHFEHRAAWRTEWSAQGHDHSNAIAYVYCRESRASVLSPAHVPVDDAIADLESMVAVLTLMHA